MTARRLLTLLLALLTADLLGVIVTGSSSLLTPFWPVGLWGFVFRLGGLGLLLVLRARVFVSREGRWSWSRLSLALLLLPTLLQFQFAGGRVNGDGVMYYVYVRSMWKDFDLDFANEYSHYGLLGRADQPALSVPTKTGKRRSIFSIGPAVVGSPFFLLGEGVGRLQSLFEGEVDLSGYGPVHRNAVALGSLLLGLAAVLLIHDLLRRHFSGQAALGAALLVWGGTFLHWYMVQQPTTSHAASAFAAALCLWLWDRHREGRSPLGFCLLGLVLGLAMSIRWQNGLLLLLPGLELGAGLWRQREGWRRVLGGGGLLAAGVLVGVLPQMSAWKVLYDMWVLPYPPHGRDFVRLGHPFVLSTLFSSRHGLLSWTPVLWAGYLGFIPLLRRRPQLAWPLLPLLLFMTYVNMCSGDWWAGASFSNRRFDSLLPILALGLAASWEAGQRWLSRRPAGVLGLAALPFLLWNGLAADQEGRAATLGAQVGGRAERFSRALGSPSTWPASWLFAWRERRSPGQYDLAVGRYLFYRQQNLGGVVEIGEGDEALLAEGWGPLGDWGERKARRISGRARLFAPLDVAEDLELSVRARADLETVLGVEVNGRAAGVLAVGPAGSNGRLQVDEAFWRRELNDVVITAGSPVDVDAVVFTRTGNP
ncbi:MAG TPA: glycosyltransferase family 39 protein [Vicinamibacteria bacterium]|nr:glycosyltransferase family 39 protein [Vicinamibacteria bacterium]